MNIGLYYFCSSITCDVCKVQIQCDNIGFKARPKVNDKEIEIFKRENPEFFI